MESIIDKIINIYGKYPVSCIYKKVVKDNDSEAITLISSAFSKHNFNENYSLEDWKTDLAIIGLMVNAEVVEFRKYYVKSAWKMFKRLINGKNSSSIKEGEG